MRTKQSDYLDGTFGRRCFLMLVFVSVGVGFCPSITKGGEVDAEATDIAAYRRAVADQDNDKAASIGKSIFAHLEEKYEAHAGFRAYKSKLDAAEFLAEQMQQQLRKAVSGRISAIAGELFDEKNNGTKARPLSVAPAKRFYETSTRLFSMPVEMEGLMGEEKSFLAQYYDLRLKALTSATAKAGQALAIAEPSFKGTHDYVLVLPLLHASEERPISIDVLPQWMRRPEQLSVFADSCLLHFGLPFHAMVLAKESAQAQGNWLSELDFYRSAAKKCGTTHAHIAADCLRRAIASVKDAEPDTVVALQHELVQLWLDSGNYALAASQAHKISEAYPDHKDAGRAIWLHYYALSRANSINEILAGIDKVLDDKRCEVYKPKLMYIKWWSLRRMRDQTAKVAALEFELLKQYGNDPMVAPILLSRATDLLASQDYDAAYESLAQLVEKFPTTQAATQAERMLAKLKTIKGVE